MPQLSDEALLWAAVEAGETPRAAGERLGIHHRRVDYLCEKWTRQGRYDYGVCVDLGWPVRAEGDPRHDDAIRDALAAWRDAMLPRISRAINTPYDVASRIQADMLVHGSAYVRDDGNGGWEHVPHDDAHPGPTPQPLRGMLGEDGVLAEHLRQTMPPRGHVEEVAAYVEVGASWTRSDDPDPWEQVREVSAKYLPDEPLTTSPWRWPVRVGGRGYGKTARTEEVTHASQVLSATTAAWERLRLDSPRLAPYRETSTPPPFRFTSPTQPVAEGATAADVVHGLLRAAGAHAVRNAPLELTPQQAMRRATDLAFEHGYSAEQWIAGGGCSLSDPEAEQRLTEDIEAVFTARAPQPAPPSDVRADIRRAMTLAQMRHPADPVEVRVAPDVEASLREWARVDATHPHLAGGGLNRLWGIPVVLDEDLKDGEWRVLTAEDVEERHWLDRQREQGTA